MGWVPASAGTTVGVSGVDEVPVATLLKTNHSY